jgi:hypothetical protein
MEETRSIVMILMVLAAAAILFRRATLDAVIEAINNFRGGGPPTPMHPSPVNDAALLRRRARTR